MTKNYEITIDTFNEEKELPSWYEDSLDNLKEFKYINVEVELAVDELPF